MRRFAAVALAASLLHLNVVRADVACSHHEADSAPAQQAGHPVLPHHDVAETTTPPSDGHTEHPTPCDTPTQTDCCQALASCTPGMAITAEMFVAINGLPHDDSIGAFIEMPLGRVTTPDPPPPRA